ncbi:hypothetical protein [Shewanella marisflavi]|uniref:hypothetical protein n=1 Tax=Shewanella marisflavi TaxID=260364 RepID=UPI003AB02D8E
MNAAVMVKPEQVIDIMNVSSIAELQQNEDLSLRDIIDMFWVGVAELRTLIESELVILHLPVSQGKDSTIVELMGLEAYRQAREAGTIEAERPLILSTVDTGGEAIPMKMYVRYCRTRLLAYAKQHGINLHYDIVKPPMNDEYFVKFTGGQKLPPLATRNGDCSIILKVDPSERHVKTLLKRFASCKSTGIDYQSAKVISCVGSREDESSRRANNMSKQGIAKKSQEDLMAELSSVTVGKFNFYKFAPIKHWKTEQVFDALRLAGERPIRKVAGVAGLPAFLPDFGLLLEIYGNGSNETCEISIGSTASSGCNGKARYGCVYCTMIASRDNSSIALSALPRWNVLGTENALRVRDFLFRLASDMDARALHARAYDPAGFNRVALQPNTLKPRHLEKMVRYASQLSLDSIRIAAEFKELVDQGRELEHPGYADIANDPYISPKTKRSFLEMYKECAQDPSCLNELFSEEHALLLSFRWSIDGIGAAPYRPLAIWHQISSGKGWIPYPELNSEYEAKHGKLSMMNGELPEAVMMPIYKVENPEQHAMSPIKLLDLWQRPLDASDVFEEDFNCSKVRVADHYAKVEADYQFKLEVSAIDADSYTASHDVVVHTDNGLSAFRINYVGAEVLALKLDGKTVPTHTEQLLIEDGLLAEIQQYNAEALRLFCEQMADAGLTSTADQAQAVVAASVAEQFGAVRTIKRDVRHLRPTTLFAGYNDFARSAKPAIHFTRRVTKMNKGKAERGNTRMTFYPVQVDSRLHLAHQQQTKMLVPDFNSHSEAFIGTHDADLLANSAEALENILLSQKGIAQWKIMGGLKKALEIHDDHMQALIQKRHLRGYKPSHVRAYAGTHVAETLLSHGVISIDKTYWAQLKAILKRTHIFNEMGFFAFQSMSVKEVLAHPRAITMQQHRKDKVEVLKVIRRHRNAQRRAIALGTNLVSVTNQNLLTLADTTRAAVHAMFFEHSAALLKMLFDTSEVGVSTKARVSRIWLSMTFAGISNVDHFLGKVLPGAQVTALKSQPAMYLSACQDVLRQVKSIRAHIETVLADWRPLLAKVEDLINDTSLTRDEALAAFKQAIYAAPWGVCQYNIVEYWKPNQVTMKAHLTNALNTIGAYVAQLDEMHVILSQIERKALRGVTHKMTLADKLALLQQRKG